MWMVPLIHVSLTINYILLSCSLLVFGHWLKRVIKTSVIILSPSFVSLVWRLSLFCGTSDLATRNHPLVSPGFQRTLPVQNFKKPVTSLCRTCITKVYNHAFSSDENHSMLLTEQGVFSDLIVLCQWLKRRITLWVWFKKKKDLFPRFKVLSFAERKKKISMKNDDALWTEGTSPGFKLWWRFRIANLWFKDDDLIIARQRDNQTLNCSLLVRQCLYLNEHLVLSV